MNDFEMQKFIQWYMKYENDKIKNRRNFEKDLFIILIVLFGILAVICFKIENYLDELVKLMYEVVYGS